MLSPEFLGDICDDVRIHFEEIVRDRVAAGALGDTVLNHPTWHLPDTLRASLATVVAPPDPAVGFRMVSGLFDSFDDLGPTPTHWSTDDRRRTAPFDIALALAATALGTAFGWTDQQEGRLVHDILPSKGFEHMQVGASSTVPLAWHSEDGFHPERADFLLLACVRNPDHIGSRLVSIRGLGLDPADISQLRRPLLTIEPDDSYEDDTASTREPVGMSTVWDGPDGLCVRYDPSYTRYLTDDEEFIAAHNRLGTAFEEHGAVVPLSPGDLLIIDNDAVVHGRVAFRPRYDGTDRWLKRVLVRSPRDNRPAAERHEHGYHQQRVFAAH
ncbi:TauD/TfdA family dioxygenase [Streptomyces sp. NPDC050625]|uniref:TauD/TfdA family dioxygenase n=1 Tax=Streptomyces sp. NPDC050625 TaxID=3154629 RepID=UPI00343F9186